MLNIPHQTRKPFKQHFIKDAFFEARFTSPIAGDWQELKDKLSPHLASIGHTKLNFLHTFSINLSPVKDEKVPRPAEQVAQSTSVIAGLVFQNTTSSLVATLFPDKIVLHSKEYVSFEDFLNHYESLISVLDSKANIKLEINWIGIRKINVLTVESSDKIYQGQGFNDSFFNILRNGNVKNTSFVSAENRYVFNEDATTLVMNIKSSKNIENNFEIALDLDMNSAKKFSDFKELSQEATDLNNKVYDVFCWVISDDLRASLEK